MLDLAIALIFAVESQRNWNAPVGRDGEHGGLQIRQCAIDDVNAYYGTAYTISDARNPEVAPDIARLYLLRWCGENASLERYARTYNGGPRGPRKPSTAKYWRRIQRAKKDIAYR